MDLKENYPLSTLNTFGVEGVSRYYAVLDDIEQLGEISNLPAPHLFLGGGSNVLFTEDFAGTIIHNQLKGIAVLFEDEQSVSIKAMAGEVWHDFVCQMNAQGYFGLEYLALIPGSVGAAPVQNIGAYGAEVKQYIQQVEAFDTSTQEVVYFDNEACKFGYRHSFFKENPHRYLILAVTFKLSKIPQIAVSYKALTDYYVEKGISIDTLSPQDIFNAVVEIRSQKLPDPRKLGNSGSFFKNPIVAKEKAEQLKQQYPNLVIYPFSQQSVKLAAGQLIDLAGLKGIREGNVGMHINQALVLVNYGGATGRELWEYAQKVQAIVRSQFGIDLEPEPLIL